MRVPSVACGGGGLCEVNDTFPVPAKLQDVVVGSQIGHARVLGCVRCAVGKDLALALNLLHMQRGQTS